MKKNADFSQKERVLSMFMPKKPEELGGGLLNWHLGLFCPGWIATVSALAFLAGHCQSTFLLVNILPARRSLIFGTLQAIKGLMTKGILREYYAKCKFSPLMVVLCWSKCPLYTHVSWPSWLSPSPSFHVHSSSSLHFGGYFLIFIHFSFLKSEIQLFGSLVTILIITFIIFPWAQ